MRVLDLFSGIGGFSLGLERAGMKTVAFCEIEEFPRKVLAKHWPGVPIYGDVKNAEFYRGQADIICAGFPCTDASYAQQFRTGTAGERTGLYGEAIRAIRMVRPSHAILENVAGLLDTGMGDVLGDLAEIGNDAEWDCISAADVGAPHERERVWIVTDPVSLGQPRPGEYFKSVNPTPDSYREAGGVVDAVQGNTLPFVCDRHDGVSKKLAESGLKALGNSVVPQIPESIGRAIMAAQMGLAA